MDRRTFLWGSGAILGLTSGCGGRFLLPEPLSGYLLLNEYRQDGKRSIVARKPDNSGRTELLAGAWLLSHSRDLNHLVISEGTELSNRYFLYQRDTVQWSAIPHPIQPYSWSPDGTRLLLGAFTNTEGLAVMMMDRTGKRTPIATVLDTLGPVRWLGNDQLTWDSSEGTFQMPLTGTAPEKISEHRFTVPSPDGRSLLRHVYLYPRGDFPNVVHLERLDLATGTIETLLEADLVGAYSWSADSQSVLFTGGQRGRIALQRHLPTGNTTRYPLPATAGGQIPAVIWSPDLQSIAYQWYQDIGADGDWPTLLEIRGAVGTFTLPEGGSPIAWL